MALNLSAAMLERAYDFLVVTPPFYTWGMPFADEVEFAVIRNENYLGFFSVQRRETAFGYLSLEEWGKIEISDRCCGHTDTLLRAMAHEMIHLYQWHSGKDTRSKHNADFKRRAKRVCEAHGWDPKLFV